MKSKRAIMSLALSALLALTLVASLRKRNARVAVRKG